MVMHHSVIYSNMVYVTMVTLRTCVTIVTLCHHGNSATIILFTLV